MTEQPLCILGFVTFTNGNGWLGMKEDNRIPLFDTCGHMVHQECRKKSRTGYDQNRVYLPCPLCKCCSNILIPDKESFGAEDYQKFREQLLKIYETIDFPVVP